MALTVTVSVTDASPITPLGSAGAGLATGAGFATLSSLCAAQPISSIAADPATPTMRNPFVIFMPPPVLECPATMRRRAGALYRKYWREPETRPSFRGDAPVGERADDGADDRGYPEQPELLQRPAADKQRRAGAPRRVHRGIRHRNADQVDQREAEADRNRRETRGRAPVRRPENDDEEH